MRKILLSGIFFILVIYSIIRTDSSVLAASPFAGKILLAVEGHGEAWYINPLDDKKYYLGRPADAFQVMKGLAIGISNADFSLLEKNQLSTDKIKRLLGRILIKPQDKGKAYYFEPNNKKIHYLGRPADAFRIMKETAVGAADEHIDPIPLGQLSFSPIASPSTTANPNTKTWRWWWNDQEYTIALELPTSTYNYYTKQPKVFTYSGSLPDNWQEKYYSQFLDDTNQYKIIKQIVEQLQQQAAKQNLSKDQTADLAAAFLQSIPYDDARGQLIQSSPNQAKPNYPYETLYLNRGVCTDKALLGWLIFHQLGYGTTLLSYESANHMALGIACPTTDANYSSGYCYLETTQFYRIGLVPENIDGQAQVSTTSLPNWQPTGKLSSPRIIKQSGGQNYNGLGELKQLLQNIINQQTISQDLRQQTQTLWPEIQLKQTEIEQYQTTLNQLKATGQTNQYNQTVPLYNQIIQAYETIRQSYNNLVNSLNESIKKYNQFLAKLQPAKSLQ